MLHISLKKSKPLHSGAHLTVTESSSVGGNGESAETKSDPGNIKKEISYSKIRRGFADCWEAQTKLSSERKERHSLKVFSMCEHTPGLTRKRARAAHPGPADTRWALHCSLSQKTAQEGAKSGGEAGTAEYWRRRKDTPRQRQEAPVPH